jgi:hypothetical protein
VSDPAGSSFSGGPPQREPVFQPGGLSRLARRLFWGGLWVVVAIVAAYGALVAVWVILAPRW